MQTIQPNTALEVQAAANNPANAEVKSAAERRRIPMNQQVQKFACDPIPGYHIHFPLNNPARIRRMQMAGYEFVDASEATLNGLPIGSDDGNMDLGSRVSIPSGGIGTDNQPEMHIMMKIREEWYQESERILEERNEGVAAALRGEHAGPNSYVDKSRTKLPDLFTPKRR